MGCQSNNWNYDHGPKLYPFPVNQLTLQNTNFRTAIWTGTYMQMTLMCIPACGEIGWEIHEDTDQYIRIEQGTAMLLSGSCRSQQDYAQRLCAQESVFVPAGTWHNIVNIGRTPLKVSSIYAPPHHPFGTVHQTKDDADSYHE